MIFQNWINYRFYDSFSRRRDDSWSLLVTRALDMRFTAAHPSFCRDSHCVHGVLVVH